MARLDDIVCCPRCLSPLDFSSGKAMCGNATCVYQRNGFPTSAGQPVLVDFEQSVFDRTNFLETETAVLQASVTHAIARPDITDRSFKARVREMVFGTNNLVIAKSADVLKAMKARSASPSMLIIGGGTRGGGVDTFYDDPSVQIFATDVYPSPNTCLLADAHCLPFRNEVFDCVWITAVLEHVLEPHVVMEQIHRVLKPGGLVYAETPFMAPVHEGAYDFTRFTFSGHRWLFRRFEQIDAGVLGGTGTAVNQSIRYFWRALGLSDKFAILLSLPTFWIRYFDRFMHGRANADAAMGFFFFGAKSDRALSPKEIIAYYATQG